MAAIVPSANAEPESLLAATDAALYRAKRKGRNRVAVAVAAAPSNPIVVE